MSSLENSFNYSRRSFLKGAAATAFRITERPSGVGPEPRTAPAPFVRAKPVDSGRNALILPAFQRALPRCTGDRSLNFR
ncbi:MAG: twin-arginine translocation signal domain-containing protein [Chthonomonadaceae bacterium]|nr:twin-arginine translocation signal domain-containing protein [Chthonomonadaceae bacterium]